MLWLALPKRTQYLLRSLSCMARSQSPLPVRAIAARERIPPSFLAKILYQLTWHGLVNSKRGPGGGFTLALPPHQIRVKQVLEVFQVPAVNRPEAKHDHDFSLAWEKLWQPTREALETLTLADLLRTEPGTAESSERTSAGTRPHRSSKRKTAARGAVQ